MIVVRYEGKYQYEILRWPDSYVTVRVKNLLEVEVDVQTTIKRTKAGVQFYSFYKRMTGTKIWYGNYSGRKRAFVGYELSNALEEVVEDWRLRLLENILN